MESEVIDVSGKGCLFGKVEMIKEVANAHKEGKPFVYLDPPYYPVAKDKNGKISPYKLYNGLDFLPVDFLKLKLHCDELTANEIPFILSNSDCEFIRVLFRDYIIVDINEARVMKQGKGKGSRPGENCLLITNFKQKEDFMNAVGKMNNLMEVNNGKKD